MKIKRIIIFIVMIISIIGIALWVKSAKSPRESKEVIQKRLVKHNADIGKIDNQWEILHQAYRFEEAKEYEKAVSLFRRATDVGDQNVPRNALLRVYEKTGQYEKALEQAEWFLKGNQNEQGRKETLETKVRLLKKMQEP